MTHLVTFSDDQISRSRRLCIESALQHGIDSIAGPHYFDPAIETRDGFTLEWLRSQPIYEQMGEVWWTQRGVGFWLWKSYIIDLVMSKLRDGDYLVYADAGVEFVNNIRYVIDRMDQDVWLFGNNWEHAHWCKRDVIEAIMPDAETWWPWHRFDCYNGGKQVQASVIFFRISDNSRAFVAEWLKWCKTPAPMTESEFLNGSTVPYMINGGPPTWPYLIDDSPSRRPNHPEFREHRHDQAILTTLAYREGIKLHYWPAEYNDGAFVYEKLPEYAGDDYPVLFHHHRRRNQEWESPVGLFKA